jgi:hypothetical protein
MAWYPQKNRTYSFAKSFTFPHFELFRKAKVDPEVLGLILHFRSAKCSNLDRQSLVL